VRRSWLTDDATGSRTASRHALLGLVDASVLTAALFTAPLAAREIHDPVDVAGSPDDIVGPGLSSAAKLSKRGRKTLRRGVGSA
jgi:hypothetical protein